MLLFVPEFFLSRHVCVCVCERSACKFNTWKVNETSHCKTTAFWRGGTSSL